MFLTLDQVHASIDALSQVHPFFGTSFLAFKRADLPVGTPVHMVFSRIAGVIMNKYYRASSSYQGFYLPFLTSDPENRWNSPRYASTSLQRITTDTFGDAFIHPKKSQAWGWAPNYLSVLRRHLQGQKVPAFDLAVWLFREEDFSPGATRQSIAQHLFNTFRISKDESGALFDLGDGPYMAVELAAQPLMERELLAIISPPPGSTPEAEATLRRIDFRYVGPAEKFAYEPEQRLNIVTGDNSLGKTFLLECVWWALTGDWLEKPVMPRTDVDKRSPSISFSMKGRAKEFVSRYNWDRQTWSYPENPGTMPGLVIYSRFDGSCAVWDPVRLSETSASVAPKLFFQRDDIWYGLAAKGTRSWMCNGIIRDWVTWQTSSGRFDERWEAFVSCLKALSPYGEPLAPGQPVKLPFDELEIPTVRMPYGPVPVIHASAGVQRVIALAYLLVWSWFKHMENSSLVRRPPQRRLVLMIDEIEAHLHPRWQRVIVPALMEVVGQLAPSVAPQIHLATHSPMVMTSAETVFNEDTDGLFHLQLTQDKVRLDELSFVKRGRADLWLMSEVFGLGHPRSLPAERAIEEAKALQLAESASRTEITGVHDRLLTFLADDDEFWPRWRYFAKQHGVSV